MRVLIVGAGGHGQVVADILLSEARLGRTVQPCGFLDHDPALWHRVVLGIPVLGSAEECAGVHHDAVIVGVGDNLTRRGLFDALWMTGERFARALHPSAVLSTSCSLGRGTVVAAGAVVNTGARIGNDVILNTGCSVDHHNEIGDHAHIAPGARLGGGVSIGEGALIGIGAVVLPGCRVGDWTVVGAGSVVTEDLADGVICVGSPARPVRRRPEFPLSGPGLRPA